MDDPRGNLMLTFGAIAAKYRPKWLVWENVPGVLSSNGGRDFGSFLGMLGQLGYGFAYRIHDAQFHGVAQRRRRVFVVGCLGDWHSAAAVLFERHSLQGHPAPSRKTGQEITGTLGARTTAGGGFGGDFETTGGLRAVETLCAATGQAGAEIGADMAPTLNCNHEEPYAFLYATSQYGEVAGALTARHDSSPCADRGQNIVVGALCKASFSGGAGGRPEGAAAGHFVPVAFQDTADCLTAAYGTKWNGNASATNGSLFAAQPVAYGIRTANTSSNGWGIQEEVTHTLDCAQGVAVRRLLPEECEKLQGFEPGYTAIPWRKKPANECPDSPRYKALGNSWAVPVAAWVGKRISEMEALHGCE